MTGLRPNKRSHESSLVSENPEMLIRRTLTLWTAVLAVLLASACASATPPRERRDPLTAVNAFVAAMTNADADALANVFSENATVFMPFESWPTRIEGREEIRRAFVEPFADMRRSTAGPPYMKLEPRDLHTQSFGDMAIVTFHLGMVPPAGATTASRLSRRTFVVRLIEDQWVIEHLHASNLLLQPSAK